MRRALIGLAVAAFTLLAVAAPASAASSQVTHFSFSGTFADAY
jgi:spermidine/putrescine-binding protein